MKRKPSSFEEIPNHLEDKSTFYDYKLIISKRTFKRDLLEIASLFDIEIEYDFRRKVYCLTEGTILNKSQSFLLDELLLLNLNPSIKSKICFDERFSQTDDLEKYLPIINSKKQIKLTYKAFNSKKAKIYFVNVYGLKQACGFWYLIASDANDELIVKSFGIDRIVEFEVTKFKAKRSSNFSISEYYKHCFGVINFADQLPERLKIKFCGYHVNYIKAHPFHNSQKIISEKKDEIVIELFIKKTIDLEMELKKYAGYYEIY